MKKYKEPAWVCLPCAYKRGAKIPEAHCYTIHVDKCGICKKNTIVTEPRDFGTTRYLLGNYEYAIYGIHSWKKSVSNDTLEQFKNGFALYSKNLWLILQYEFLYRMENEIYISE